MLSEGRYYPIGADGQKEHVHKAIYSPKDDRLFVVVQDSDNHDVITLLPLEYHNAWRIDHEAIETLAREALGAPPLMPQGIPEPPARLPVYVNLIGAAGVGEDGRKTAPPTTCVMAGHVYGHSLRIIGIDPGEPPDHATLSASLASATAEALAALDDAIDEVIGSDEELAASVAAATAVRVAMDCGARHVSHRRYAGAHSDARRKATAA